MLLNSEDSSTPESRKKLWLSDTAIVALITASTAAILLCPCDCIGQSPRAIILVFISIAFGLAAAVLVFRRMKQNSGLTAFLKAVGALAIVGAGVYAEFAITSNFIAWLAGRGQ